MNDTLRGKVAFLGRPGAYPEATAAVEPIETHMSWVFLTDRFAYKLKKPVRYPFLDFSTLEAREHDCREELRLNQRLAPDVYLAVVPLVRDEQGQLGLDRSGTPVDWLVKMRRLPERQRLDQGIAQHRVAESAVRRLARRLVSFYRSLPQVVIAAEDYRRRFTRDIAAARQALAQPGYGQDGRAVATLCGAMTTYLEQRAAALDRRVGEGRIVEGHGDLRPEHVYLDGEVLVTDCLEFNRDLRTIDPADEIAYLAMECERLGAPSVRAWLFDAYRRDMADAPPADLIAFYTCFRACLRARIALAHLDEPAVDRPERWIERGRQYLRLAQRHAGDLVGTSA